MKNPFNAATGAEFGSNDWQRVRLTNPDFGKHTEQKDTGWLDAASPMIAVRQAAQAASARPIAG